MAEMILKPGREKSLLRHHPWIFSGAIARVEGNPEMGETVDVLDSKGGFLARAAYSPHSQIRGRVWTFEPAEAVDADFFRRQVRAALDLRKFVITTEFAEGAEKKEKSTVFSVFNSTNALRLIHAESDGIPGLVVDRYADVLVLQSLSAGSDAWKETLADILIEETGLQAIYERSDADVRQLEGLQKQVGVLRGVISNPQFTIIESRLKFLVNLESGHKTGFYLDQRNNRLKVRQMAEGRDVLDCFCYTGGFTINALVGKAKSVVSIDASADALALGQENAKLNGLPESEWIEGDVFQLLRKFRDSHRSFDMIILDPPKFAQTASQAEKAARGYKDINLLAFKLLRPGGILFTFSCSGGVDAALFQKIVAGAALDAGVDAQIVGYMQQGADHPIGLNFPEGAYLKGLICIKS